MASFGGSNARILQGWGTCIPLWAWSCSVENSAELAKCYRACSSAGQPTSLVAAHQHKHHQACKEDSEWKSHRSIFTSVSRYTSREFYLVLRHGFTALFVPFGPRKRVCRARSRTVFEAKYSIPEKFPIASPCSMSWGHENKVVRTLTAPVLGRS